jgi:hypothetical protein
VGRLLVTVPLFLLACGGGPQTGVAAPPSPRRAIEVQQTPESKTSGESASPGPASSRTAELAACAKQILDVRDVNVSDSDLRLYDEARAAEVGNDLTTARKIYFELIQNHPTSKLTPLASLALADQIANEALSSPRKLDLARWTYSEVIKHPPPDNVAYPYALLRLADTESAIELRDRASRDPWRYPNPGARALEHYGNAIETTRQYSALPCSNVIRSVARVRTVDLYARFGAPDRAYTFFASKEEQDEAVGMVENLVGLYRRAEKSRKACAAVRGIPHELDQPSAARLRHQMPKFCTSP